MALETIRGTREEMVPGIPSTPYERRQAALNGIESMKKNARDAEVAVQDGE